MLPLVLALLAQQPVTRADAVAAALTRGARVALGRTDTIAALGAARTARAFPNPTVAGSYTKDTPNYHLLGDLPLDLPWLRAPRIGAAEAARDAARSQFVFDRAGVVFDVDTTYTRALATALHARLSRRTADDADSLLKIAQLRRDVGDVSELDVRLAAVNAGQLQNAAIDDSLTALGTLLDLQLQMGLAGDTPTITLVDSLAAPEDSAPLPTEGAAVPGEYLPVAAAAARLRSAERTLSFTRASRFAPSVEFGFDTGDPASTRPSELLPVIGFSLPFPLFNRSGGEVTRAVAERDRARAALRRPRVECQSHRGHVAPGVWRGRRGAGERARSTAQRARDPGALHRRSRRRRRGAARPALAHHDGRTAMKGRLPGLALVLVAMACCHAAKESSDEGGGVVGVGTAVATREPFPQAVNAIGTVSARPGRYAALSPPGPTRVARIFVVAGQRVSRGDSLIEFEHAPFEAAAQSAAATLANAERTYARAARLAQAGILPQKDADQAAADLAAARSADVTARRANELATLRAPIAT